MWKRLAGSKQDLNKLSLGGSLAHHRISPKGQEPTSGPRRGDSNKLVVDFDRRKRGQAFQRDMAW